MADLNQPNFPPGDAGVAGPGGTSSAYEPWVEQFRNYVLHLAQQEESRLRTTVRNEMCTGEYHNFERLGASDAIEKITRHTETPTVNVPHSRRRVPMKDFLWADLIDEEDRIRALIDYNGAYTRNAAMAMGREWDKLIIAAATGNALDGSDTPVALPAGQVVAGATEQLTISKVTQAKYILDKNEIKANDRFLVCSAQEIQSMLNTTEITSSDYNTVRALRNGEVDFFLGFKWIRTELLDEVGAGPVNRQCLAYQKDAIGLAIGRDVVTKVDQRPDVSYAWQVFAAFSANAVRVEDEGVVRIDCDVAPA